MAGHHYVPQFYLKNFRISNTKASIYVYFRNGEIKQKNISNIASKGHMYNFVDKNGEINRKLEKAFSTIEYDNQSIIQKILESKSISITEDEHQRLSYFISTLYVRGLAYRDKLTATHDAAIKTMMGLTAESKEAFHRTAKQFLPNTTSTEKIESARLSFLDGTYRIEHDPNEILRLALKSAETIYPYILNKKLSLLKRTGDHFFATSDNPVIIGRDSPRKDSYIVGNGGLIYSSVILTLSPDYCLFISPQDDIPENIEVQNEDVDEVNYLLAFYAERMIFADESHDHLAQLMSITEAGQGQTTVVEYNKKSTVYNPKK